MIISLLIDLVVATHLLFILFVVFGALLCLRWPKVSYVHLPCLVWGVLISFFQWICPLTPLEQYLRTRAGVGTYHTGFIDHYIMPLVYPPGLTPGLLIALGIALLVGNLLVYTIYLKIHGVPDVFRRIFKMSFGFREDF